MRGDPNKKLMSDATEVYVDLILCSGPIDVTQREAAALMFLGAARSTERNHRPLTLSIFAEDKEGHSGVQQSNLPAEQEFRP